MTDPDGEEEDDDVPLERIKLLGSLPGMVYRCRADRRWTLEFVSEGSLELTGYRPDELLTREREAFADMIVPLDRPAVELAVEAAIRERRPYTLEYRIVDRHGAVRHVWERGRLLRGEGTSAVLEGFVTDVTACKRNEYDLGERVKELRLVYELAALLSDRTRLDEALWKVAARVPEAYCYPPELGVRIALEGRVYTSPRFFASDCRQVATIAVDGRSVGEIEVCRLVDDGQPPATYFLPEEQQMLDAVAERIAVQVERERMLAALRASERRARDLYERLPVATAVWQRRGDDFVLVDHNAAASALTGGAVRGMVGRTLRALLPGRRDLLEALSTCAATGSPSRRELAFTAPDGRAFSLVLSLGPVPPDLVLAHVADVTHERRLEQRIQQAEKMEVLGRMAAGVAHDFNNLLTVILSYSDLILREAAGGPHRADLLEIRKAGERAAAMTRQLLTFSRQQIVSPQLVDVGEQVTDLLALLRQLLGDDITLTTALSPDLWPVRIDPGQLDQLVLNLVVNARDATPRGGRVAIAAANVELREDEAAALDLRPGPHVALTVSDTGTGIDPAARTRLFEPFFTTKPPGQGTGMGLAIVYGIVRQGGGGISVESEPGKGASFRVLLPRAEGSHPPASQPPTSPRTGGGETILLVEDEASVRLLAQRILSEAGYRVLTAADGNEALHLCERHDGPIDLLVTDLVMPWTGGISLATRFSALHPRARVLFVSGYPDRALELLGPSDLVASFLAKPFTAETLTRMVRRLLDS